MVQEYHSAITAKMVDHRESKQHSPHVTEKPAVCQPRDVTLQVLHANTGTVQNG